MFVLGSLRYCVFWFVRLCDCLFVFVVMVGYRLFVVVVMRCSLFLFVRGGHCLLLSGLFYMLFLFVPACVCL